MKVLIGTPCGETVSALTAQCLVAAAVTLSRSARIGYAIQQGSLVDINQGNLAAAAVVNGFDYLWLVDSDMTFPPNIGPRLLATYAKYYHKTIVGCTYPNRMIPTQFTGRYPDGTRPQGSEQGCALMAYLGTGMLLIPTQVFRDIEPPWFPTGVVDGEYRGNDMSFCYKADEAKYSVICDFDISRDVGHVGAVEHKGAWIAPPSELKQQVDAVREEMASWPAWRKSEIEAEVVKTPLRPKS